MEISATEEISAMSKRFGGNICNGVTFLLKLQDMSATLKKIGLPLQVFLRELYGVFLENHFVE